MEDFVIATHTWLDNILKRYGYHEIFPQPDHDRWRWGWGNDAGDPKLPRNERSRRVVLATSGTLIVRSPSLLAKRPDGSTFAWRVLGMTQIDKPTEATDFLAIPHMGVLPSHYFLPMVDMLGHVRNRCGCAGWDIDHNVHTEAEHTNCGGFAAYSGHCGGCHECIGMQTAYYRNKAHEENHKGLCAEKDKHEPHDYMDATMGPFRCTGDPADREPFRSETRRREINA